MEEIVIEEVEFDEKLYEENIQTHEFVEPDEKEAKGVIEEEGEENANS